MCAHCKCPIWPVVVSLIICFVSNIPILTYISTAMDGKSLRLVLRRLLPDVTNFRKSQIKLHFIHHLTTVTAAAAVAVASSSKNYDDE